MDTQEARGGARISVERYRHDTMNGREFIAAMASIGMSEREFSKLTGARPRTIDAWKEEGCPYWVTTFFACLDFPFARERLHEIADQNLMSEAEYRALRDADL